MKGISMAEAGKKTAMTNTTPKSCAEVTCDCNTMWSLAQQFSSTRLCMETGNDKGTLVRDYAVRARRIAATYARFYLEKEDGGDEKKWGATTGWPLERSPARRSRVLLKRGK
jgi:hypothetical protein